jgi:GTP cyclohydrolase I
VTENQRAAIRGGFARILEYTEREERDGTRETPARATSAWLEKTRGYALDPAEHFKTFETEATSVRGMVIVRDIEVESMCEHHLERIWGYAHIGYLPTKHVLGLSKFSRVVNVFARRLQVQERLTAEIADCLMDNLEPAGVGVVLEARHGCMETRGIQRRGQTTVTSELRGCFYSDPTTRAEFLALARTAKPF